MKPGDAQVGAPQVLFSDTAVNLAARTDLVDGMIAWDTTNECIVRCLDGVWVIAGGARQLVVFSTFEGIVNVGENPLRISNQSGVTRTIIKVYLTIATAPTGQDLIVDVHMDEVTIFTQQVNRPRILAAASSGFSVAIDVPSWVDGSYLTALIDQKGSTIAGAYLIVHVIYTEA